MCCHVGAIRWSRVRMPTLSGLDRYRRSLRDLACGDTPGAHTHTPAIALVVDDLHRLKVRQPAAPRLVVRVADVVPRRGALATRVAHSSHLSIPASFGSSELRA